MGRAARNANSEVVMYADQVTQQMQEAIDETQRRRHIQMEYNEKHGITPETILKAIRRGIENELKARKTARAAFAPGRTDKQINREELLGDLERAMLDAAARLEFEKAAALRDRLNDIRDLPTFDGADGDGMILREDLEDSRRPKPGMARSRAGLARGKKNRRH